MVSLLHFYYYLFLSCSGNLLYFLVLCPLMNRVLMYLVSFYIFFFETNDQTDINVKKEKKEI